MFSIAELEAQGFTVQMASTCNEHNGLLYQLVRFDTENWMIVIPCSQSRQEAIDKAVDMLTHPNGPEGWMKQQSVDWFHEGRMGG